MDAADAAAEVAGPRATTAVPATVRRGWRDPRLRKVVQVILSAALVVGIFWYVLQQFADLSEVWAAVQTLTWLEVFVLVMAAGWNLATSWVLTVIATPGLTYPQAVVLTESTTAVSNSLPAGGALGVGLTYSCCRRGASRSRDPRCRCW
jgi:putative heme transporter